MESTVFGPKNFLRMVLVKRDNVGIIPTLFAIAKMIRIKNNVAKKVVSVAGVF